MGRLLDYLRTEHRLFSRLEVSIVVIRRNLPPLAASEGAPMKHYPCFEVYHVALLELDSGKVPERSPQRSKA